jgi:hypothetical protein
VLAGCGDGDTDAPPGAEVGPVDALGEGDLEDGDREDDGLVGAGGETEGSSDDGAVEEGSGSGETGAADETGAAQEPGAEDPYAIPEDGIDEAYVEKVLEAIFEVNREALELTLATEVGDLAPFEAEQRFRAIYGGAYGAHQMSTLYQVAGSQSLRSQFRDPVGRVRVTDVQVLDATSECVVARRTLDFSDVLQEPGAAIIEFVALSLQVPDGEMDWLNPTPWRVTDASIDSADTLQCQ